MLSEPLVSGQSLSVDGGGLVANLLRKAGGWEPRLWVYAVSAVVLYSRAAADRLGSTVPEIAAKIADELGLDLTAAWQSSG